MGKGKVESNGIQIYYEDFGDPDNVTTLFISGSSGQCTRWPMELIDPIVDAGYHVVRFDNRDVGYSTWIDADCAKPFTLEDMADDAVGLLDALEIEKAHIFGGSMGGMIAQIMAINHRERVLTLTSWMSSYDVNDPEVPSMNAGFAEWFLQNTGEGYPQDRKGIIDININAFKKMTGSRFSFDEEEQRAIEEREYDRAYNPKLYQALDMTSSPSRLDALRQLDVPTLVIHGDEDPMIRYIHGVICAKVIPGAKLLTLKGVGHEVSLAVISEIIPAMLEHFA